MPDATVTVDALPPADDETTTETSTEEASGVKEDIVKTEERARVFFSTKNSQSDGKNTLKRISFAIGEHSHDFMINPEEYNQTEPNRMTVTQTKGGAYVDEFGSGIVTFSMKGTTGFKRGTKNPLSGFQDFKSLRDQIRYYMDTVQPGQEITDDQELVFHNYTDGEHWVVVPKTFSLLRSVSRPLLYLYDIQLVGIRPAYQPSGRAKVENQPLTTSVTKVEVED